MTRSEHYRAVNDHDILLQEVAKLLLGDARPGFEMMNERTTSFCGERSPGLHLLFRWNPTFHQADMTILMGLDGYSAGEDRLLLNSIPCAIIGVFTLYRRLEFPEPESLTLGVMDMKETQHWRYADEDELTVAAMKLMAARQP